MGGAPGNPRDPGGPQGKSPGPQGRNKKFLKEPMRELDDRTNRVSPGGVNASRHEIAAASWIDQGALSMKLALAGIDIFSQIFDHIFNPIFCLILSPWCGAGAPKMGPGTPGIDPKK